MRCVPIMGVLGFVFGCCLTVIFALLFIPVNQLWPSLYENKLSYLHDLVVDHNYTFRSGVYVYQNRKLNWVYDDEQVYLTKKAKMLCYSVGAESDDDTHTSIIITTWAQHCDKSLIFYSSKRLLEKLNPIYLSSTKVKLLYIDSSNSTIGTLLHVLKSHTAEYSWFTYVPAKVFLLPNNLKYYIVSSNADPQRLIFVGKPEVGKLFGTWEVSERSPLAMSAHAVTVASNTASSCQWDSIQDPGCIIEVTKGKLYNIRNGEGDEVVTSVLYNNFLIKYGNTNVKDSVTMHFPASVHIRGDYKNLMDLEYFFHHLAAYGTQSINGAFTRRHLR